MLLHPRPCLLLYPPLSTPMSTLIYAPIHPSPCLYSPLLCPRPCFIYLHLHPCLCFCLHPHLPLSRPLFALVCALLYTPDHLCLCPYLPLYATFTVLLFTPSSFVCTLIHALVCAFVRNPCLRSCLRIYLPLFTPLVCTAIHLHPCPFHPHPCPFHPHAHPSLPSRLIHLHPHLKLFVPLYNGLIGAP